jgi:Poxvirus Late Transcription Factor VLTF3 like
MIDEDIDILSIDNKIKIHFDSEIQKHNRYNDRLLCIENLLLINNLRPKISLDLLMDKQYLQSKLVTSTNVHLYSVETSDIIQKYLTIINTPMDTGAADCNDLVLKRREIVEEFIKVAKSYLSESLLKSLELMNNFGKEDLLNTVSVVCACGNDKDFVKDDDVYICQICYTETIKLVNSSSFNDGSRVNVCNKYTYDRKVHFKDCINQYQGKQNTNINPGIYDELEEQLVSHQIISDQKDKNGNVVPQSKRFKMVTRAHILFFLKQLGYTKHYEDTILIHYTLTGKRPDNIEHLEEKLMADFDKLTEQYDLLFKDIERKNFINTQYVLFQLLRKHGYNCNKDDFAVLKTTERKACHDDICKTLFDALGWKYMFVM